MFEPLPDGFPVAQKDGGEINASSSDVIIRANNRRTRLRIRLYLRYNPTNLPA